jgi:CRISPR-associated protein Cmr3
MSKYLIKLKPLSPFFFGGEINYNRDFDNEYKNYLVKSNYYPQQTSILGMLRKQVLKQEGLLKNIGEYKKSDSDNNNKFIGCESFNINKKKKQQFGKINSISNVFILQESKDKEYKHIVKVPKDIKHDKEVTKEYQSMKLSSLKSVKSSLEGEKGYELEGYDSKKYFKVVNKYKYLDSDKILDIEDIFIDVEQIGISKNKLDDAYYKKTSYLLKKNFYFAIYVNMDYKLKDDIVYLGGEGSAFKMMVEEIDKYIYQPCDLNDGKSEKVILLSDTYLGDNPYKYCCYAITNTIVFRNRCTKKNTYKSENIKERYLFLESGSVLYTNNMDELINQIKSYENLRNIGYNKVYIQEGNTNEYRFV